MNKNWHSFQLSDVYKEVESDEKGLSEELALERLRKFGKNILPQEKPLPAIRLLLSQFNSPLVFILLIAFSVSLYMSHVSDAIFIIVVLLINTSVGFYQEYKADRSLLALKQVVKVVAKVFRDGNLKEIDSSLLVPGDVVLLRAGDKVPADCRIIESKGIKVNESSLTGEWLSVFKENMVAKEDAPLGDRTNMLFMSTLVEEGRGMAVVVSTGSNTTIGEIVNVIKDTKDRKTPLQKKLERLSKMVSVFILSIIFLVAIIGILRGQSFNEIFLASLALTVSAIPSGLLPVITVILVLGMNRILKQKGLIRKLVANETLGSVTVICTDKTGTLTEGKMRVSHIYASKQELLEDTEGLSFKDIKNGIESHITALKISLFTSEAFIENPDDEFANWIVRGQATEQALVLAATQAGLEQRKLNIEYPSIDQLPFDSNIKYSASLRSSPNDKKTLYVQGAPEVIVNRSTTILSNENKPITDAEKDILKKKIDTLASKGLRIVACAYRDIHIDESQTDISKLAEKLIFVGFVAIKDPLREDAKHAIHETKRAGIRTILITGDHKNTALAIAQEVGIVSSEETVLEGKDLEAMDEKTLKEKAKTINIYARVSPNHKLRIVKALQAGNEVVAMIGDGVNDAPALKAADVGVSVGSGTDVAKEVADVVLLDNNFKTIVKAIEQGRLVFENIRKVFVYLVADDFSELFLFLAAMMLGLPLPLVAAQILWINLVEDGFPNLALTTEQETNGIMDEKPRDPNEPILNKPLRQWMVVLFFATGLTAFLSFIGFWKMTGSLETARTMTFALMCLDSLIFAFSVRSFNRPMWRKDIFSNSYLNGAFFVGLSLLFLAVYFSPLQKLLTTQSIPVLNWFIIIGISTVEITLIEFAKKKIFRKKIVSTKTSYAI